MLFCLRKSKRTKGHPKAQCFLGPKYTLSVTMVQYKESAHIIMLNYIQL